MAMSNSSSYTTGSGPVKMIKFEERCFTFPPKVISPGLPALLLDHNNGNEKLLDYSAPRLQFQMSVIFVLTQTIHSLLKILGLPVFVSQILAGIILGPTVFPDAYSLVNISEDSVGALGNVGGFGFVIFLFLSGVKTDVSLTYKSGKKAVYIGILTVVMPLIFCLITIKMRHWAGNLFMNKTFFLATSYAGTSFPVIHCLLSELKILNSELGRLVLSSAQIGDMVTLVLTMFGMWVNSGIQRGLNGVFTDIGMATLFIFIVLFVLRPVMKWVVNHTPEAGQIKDICFYFVVATFMIAPRISHYLQLNPKYGAIIFGLSVPDGPPLGSALVEKLDPITSGLFLPIFTSTCGMRFNLTDIKHPNQFAKDHAIGSMVTLVVKFGVSLVLAVSCRMPVRDSLAFALIMIYRGTVEIGSYSAMYDKQVMSGDLFGYMTIMIVSVASVVPVLVKWLYDPSRKYLCFQKRTIMNSKLNQELRMIGCVHVPGHVNSIINLFHAFCPTKESSIALDVLHLVKLNGRATPQFIAHHKQIKTNSDKSYSENVIVAFNHFQRSCWEAVSVNVFTAVSPPTLMYEDTCKLAMDRLTSFIILPFHRRWCIDGSIESEDQTLQCLNFDILERAPCSVGILVEVRRHLKSPIIRDTLPSHNSSYYNIGVIFMGGQDDREALALAKRISQHKSVRLTVIHLKAKTSLGDIMVDTERMLDDEMLRDIKKSVNLTYIDKKVKDGPETSTFLRSIVEDYQLIIVGRRYRSRDPQTLGLEEWCEFQELGIIGDLLSSLDFVGDYSLLIVQQQRQRAA
ncbi:cation/H+ exchanger 4 [Hibiscus trionum]|uniref:Cation/H+ exchanger 4 n=1 Tax=Hibiscus trionum TaxID=183268 RepID=A0A9W7JJD1_HIBTR|nr:cation/H+ exchanger 4 [Hibiscus trionum]